MSKLMSHYKEGMTVRLDLRIDENGARIAINDEEVPNYEHLYLEASPNRETHIRVMGIHAPGWPLGITLTLGPDAPSSRERRSK